MSEYIVEFGYEPPSGVKERIVRCRDCEHYDQDDEPSEIYPDRYLCDKMIAFMPPDGFCSFGKRKEVD